MNDIFESLRLNFKRKEDTRKISINEKNLLREIRSVTADLACAEAWFQFEQDSDMLESCIYYTESLKARYRYLLKKAKSNNISVLPL